MGNHIRIKHEKCKFYFDKKKNDRYEIAVLCVYLSEFFQKEKESNI